MKNQEKIDFNNLDESQQELLQNAMNSLHNILSSMNQTTDEEYMKISAWQNKPEEEKIEYMKNHPIEKNIYVGDSEKFISVEILKEYVNNDQFSYVIAKNKETGELIGLVCDWSNGERNILGEYFDYHQRILDSFIQLYKIEEENKQFKKTFKCENCGEEVGEDDKICPHCNLAFEEEVENELEEQQEVFECGNCGKEVSSEAKKCPYCKYEFEE